MIFYMPNISLKFIKKKLKKTKVLIGDIWYNCMHSNKKILY